MNTSTLSPLAQKALALLTKPMESHVTASVKPPVIKPAVVVLVESKGERALAIVEFMSMEEAGSNLRPGLWLCLVPADGEWFWCHESRIIDRCPACPACGRPDRWQKIGQAIVCTDCLWRAT
jgi:hypothetical protein